MNYIKLMSLFLLGCAAGRVETQFQAIVIGILGAMMAIHLLCKLDKGAQ